MAKPRYKEPQSSPEQVFVETIIKGLGQLFRLLFRRKQTVDSAALAKIRVHWSDVEAHLAQESTRALAVSEADKLLDAALQVHKVAGSTMGERLKSAENLFSHSLYQRIWDAHKLRNHLAHEMGATVSAAEAQQAVGAFREAMGNLGVLQ